MKVPQSRIYLDHAATSPLRVEARQAMIQAFEQIGNPAARHTTGRAARAMLEDARESLASDLGASPDQVVFTSGGSEANTIALLGTIREGRDKTLVSALEHPSVGQAVKFGANVIPATDGGEVDLDQLIPMLDERVRVASVMMVNNETGIVQPVSELVELCARTNVWFHTDAVQALGRMDIRFHDLGADLLSISAHKIGGPVGVGALLVDRRVGLKAVGLGGGQERGVRSGTQPLALVAGFAAAVRAAVEEMDNERARISHYSNRMVEIISGIESVRLNTGGVRVPHILSATFDSLRGDDLLMLLDQAGVDASIGSACRSGVQRPSRTLLAMGLSDESAQSTLRFSLGHTTTESDIERLEQVLPGIVAAARVAYSK